MKSESTKKRAKCKDNEKASEVSSKEIGEDENGQRKMVAGLRSGRTCSIPPLGDMETKSE